MEAPKRIKKKHVGNCSLCLQEKELLTNSHILPKFLLKKILNRENKGFVVLSFDASKSDHVYDHNYEANILCADCDNRILGGYEDYGSKFLFGNLGKKDILDIAKKDIHAELGNVNYQKLKMFLLSILWKCSISKTFELVSLHPEVEERIRDLLYQSLYSCESEFPIVLWSYADANDIPKEFILPPWVGDKIDDERNFHFLGGGIFLQIILEYRTLSPIIQEAMLRENGSVKIVSIPSFALKPIINKIIDWEWLK